ncbi:SERPINI1 [Symbiodinium natans]|uniref:SERPINI1 protein n=1 Tax=Symbiodinium natans TaxID=878477 RepID=A0A812PWM4_9DINO|nr:SERPINI1 [Symbiodinium natans]
MSLAATVNPLGFSLFRLMTSRPGENVLISPLSISGCLSMVAAGSTEGSGTEKELMSLLNSLVPGLPADSTVKMANSAWVRMLIRPDYVEAVQARFGAEARELGESADPTPINEWVKEKTFGRIGSLFDGALDPLTVLVLVNTVFFKGSWAKVFDVTLTKKSEFKGFSSSLPCDMMYQKEKKVAYTENGIYQAVRLPYSDKKTWATIVLPKKEGADALSDVAASVDKTWAALEGELRPEEVELRLPRFRLSAGGSIKAALQELGLKETFVPKGGFLKMSDNPGVCLSEVVHKATLEVNEEGTVAAAATGAVMTLCGLPAPALIMRMTVDRPFLFILSDNDGTIYFLGQIVMPELAGLEAILKL